MKSVKSTSTYFLQPRNYIIVDGIGLRINNNNSKTLSLSIREGMNGIRWQRCRTNKCLCVSFSIFTSNRVLLLLLVMSFYIPNNQTTRKKKFE